MVKIRTDWEVDVLGMSMPQSISSAAEILGVCYRTWKRYERVAKKLSDYEREIGALIRNANEHGLAEIPVTPYRLWAIGKIAEAFSILPQGTTKTWLVEEIVRVKPEDFSKLVFLKKREYYRRERNAEVYTDGSSASAGHQTGRITVVCDGSTRR